MPKAEAIDDSQASGSTAKRVLLVDDHVDTREMYAILLRDRGYLVHEAPDGPSALVTLHGNQLDAAIVDISLPGMDGYEVARQVRRQPTWSHLRLVALTGWGQDHDRERARDAGFDHHLTKPVELSELYRVIR